MTPRADTSNVVCGDAAGHVWCRNDLRAWLYYSHSIVAGGLDEMS